MSSPAEGAVAKPFDEYLRNMKPQNLLFAASSVLLLLVTVWMVMDDYSRGWKGYQKEFARIEADRARADLQTARENLDQEQLAALRQELEQARAGLEQQAGQMREAEAALREGETLTYKDDLKFRTVKSTYDAVKFDYEEALHKGSPAAAGLRQEMDELERQIDELKIALLEHGKATAAAEQTIAELTRERDTIEGQIAELTSELERPQTKLDTVAPEGLMGVAIGMLNAPMLDFLAPTIKIQQVVLNEMPLDINFTKIPRADRCQSCHLAADRVGFEDEEEPFRSHPRLDLFVGSSSSHPIDRFGCTPCHGGRDRAVEFVYATHTPDSPGQRREWEERYGWERDHYWEYPMLAGSRIEASCLKCHQNVVSVPEAPRLNRGRELIERVGCYGCHKMRGYEDRPKVGPPLTRLTSKTGADWMARWIKNPKAFRPSTRMPRLFGLPNHQEEGDAEREDAEILGIVAYLTSKATEFALPPFPGGGDPAGGEQLVKSVGCLGCHALDRFEVEPEVMLARSRGEAADPIPWERRHGPDLSRVGSKLKPDWLFAWVQNPHDYNPSSRMPRLRLTHREALDVTSYLMTLTDDTPEARQVVAPRPQPEARDKALMAYLTQRSTPADAEARLASMSEHDRDVLLGERTISRSGCFGCHLIPGFETTPPIGVDLSEEGSKHPDLLYFGFQRIEHTAPAWFYQKLRSPRSFDEGKVATFYDRLRMPQFHFSEEEADAITLVLQGLTKEKMPLESVRRLSPRDSAVEAGRSIIRDYNCRGCHIYEGGGGAIRDSIARNYIDEGRGEEEARSLAASFSPPIIDGEGDKVQPEWLFNFLKDPEPIRPWLAVRMPSFDFDDGKAGALVHHFAAKADRTFPFQTFPQAPPGGPELQAALTMFAPDYFNCWSCHQQGARKPEGPPEGWAPDLTLARQRLNPDWIERWIANPQALMPGTKMPTYYDPEDLAGSAPPDILEGDPQKQIEALANYVFNLGRGRRSGSGAQP